jgi:hypothetical protein
VIPKRDGGISVTGAAPVLKRKQALLLPIAGRPFSEIVTPEAGASVSTGIGTAIYDDLGKVPRKKRHTQKWYAVFSGFPLTIHPNP